MTTCHDIRRICCLLALVAAVAPAAAADPAEDEPIHIQARSVEANDKTGMVVYSGNVRAEQGDLSIQADRVEIHARAGKTELIRAIGKPVKLRRRANDANEEILAEAGRVDYRVSSDKIDMFGNVSLRRGKDLFTADTLHYDIDSKSLNAAGDDKGAGWIRAVIQPKKSGAASPP